MTRHDHQLHEGESLQGRRARAADPAKASNGPTCARRCSTRWPSFDKPASAYDIAEAVSKRAGRRVAANSVYRILDLFVGANLARRVESANAYVANQHPGCLHDCIFLICDNCGQAVHIDDDSLTERRPRRGQERRLLGAAPGDRGARHAAAIARRAPEQIAEQLLKSPFRPPRW